MSFALYIMAFGTLEIVSYVLVINNSLYENVCSKEGWAEFDLFPRLSGLDIKKVRGSWNPLQCIIEVNEFLLKFWRFFLW